MPVIGSVPPTHLESALSIGSLLEIKIGNYGELRVEQRTEPHPLLKIPHLRHIPSKPVNRSANTTILT